MHWKRIFIWSALILATANVIAFASGIYVGQWVMADAGLTAATAEQTLGNVRLVRRVLIGIAVALLYWRFAVGTPSRRFLHVVAVFVGVQCLDVLVSAVLFGTATTDLLDPRAMLRALVAMLAGYGLARVFPGRAAITTAWVEGGLYVAPGEDGTFRALKILKLDDEGVHVRIYSNVFRSMPASIDEASLYLAGSDHAPDEPLGMGHLPLSKQAFATWHPTLIQSSAVSAGELEGYALWLEAEGGYF